ncbi:hypothetical protein LguiA_013442 [Lonicera macranthoides]
MGGREDAQLNAAKRAYRHAAAEGNRQEEARWANVIGDILKNRGEYVKALKWLRIDYEVSVKYLPEKQLLPTCQSLGEVYLRLQHFQDALIYQKKHLELAKDANDLIEQQRASTQLGRTHHEMFLRSEVDHYSIRNAKKYFKSAMKLAQTLMENSPSNKSTFLKEYIDAHNNIGMIEMDLDNLEEAQKVLTRGLEICDEEEVIEDDDGRTRLHHNLGNVFMELRKWDKARHHIEKDIIICKNIGHCQGEAKGYINLGELHYRVQKYEEAILCYQKALELAKSMEDEDALASQIEQNIETVKQVIKVNEELKNEEQNLKKLARNMGMVRGTSSERKCLLQQNACLDRLIEKSSMIFAWLKHRDFAKRKKKIASEICDKEKLGDSYLVIGESYQKLRNFNKALKWYTKSWETYNSIGNLEGQALAKINVGDVLDSDGNWAGALDAFEEGYRQFRIALKANLPSVQLSALENMHYSHMIRFDNVEEARRLQSSIDKLKQSKAKELERKNMVGECCSETETEGDDQLSNSPSDVSYSPMLSESIAIKSNSRVSGDELNDDAPLVSLLRSSKKSSKLKPFTKTNPREGSPRSMSRSTGSHSVGRKRVRVVLSDDEDENNEVQCCRGRVHRCPTEDVATSDEFKNRDHLSTGAKGFQDVSPVGSKCAISECAPVNLEESTCSFKSRSSKLAAQDVMDFRFSSTDEVVHTSHFCANGSKNDTRASENPFHKQNTTSSNLHACDNECCQHIIVKIEEDYVHVEPGSCMVGDVLNIERMKAEVACLYYLQLPIEKRSRGLLPIIQHIKCGGRVLESLEAVDILKDYLLGKGWIEVSIDVWVPKRLMKLYIDCCKELSEPPNMKLLKKLYNLEVSEDEVVVSDCELQDISIAPLFNALHFHKTVALLDLSHNLLGNQTMEKLRQVFTSSSQKYGGLVLDLHCNSFGPTSLFQICECPVLISRLEVLNISGNRLTDSCATYFSTILKSCKALYSLNIECCSITSRTIQTVADSLDSGSVLTQICLGHNHPISGKSLVNLLAKLATLKRFSELNLSGLKLSKPVLDSLCQLAKTSCLSELMLGSTNIGTDGALQLMDSLCNETQELVKLDLSSCGLTSEYIFRLNAEVSFFSGILELNLGGNPIMHDGGNALVSLLTNPQCSLRVLVLSKCQLGLTTVLRLLQSLAENSFLEDLNVAGNTSMNEIHSRQYNSTTKQTSTSHTDPNISDSAIKAEAAQQDLCAVNTDCNNLEVADSEEDDQIAVKMKSKDSCTSSSHENRSDRDCQFIQDFSIAIANAKQLQVLDLSNNGFSEQTVDTFYAAWSSGLRAIIARRHIKEHTVHFSVEGNSCCGVKPCCRKI